MLKSKDVAMQFIESNISLYRFLVHQLDERTPRVFMDRGDVNAANYLVLFLLEQGVRAKDVAEYRRHYTGPVEEAEISEGVVLLSEKVLNKVGIDGWADADFGIYVLFDMLDLWDQEYIEFYITPDMTRIESTFQFEREYEARVRVKRFLNAR